MLKEFYINRQKIYNICFIGIIYEKQNDPDVGLVKKKDQTYGGNFLEYDK